MKQVLAVVLAGGKGSRLGPLTRDRAKPAVPFGGIYRIIDFPLSNCINSGLRQIVVLTQYKAMSLDRHINMGWGFLCRELGEYVEVVPPQQRIGEQWYQGTADAVYQNIYSIEKSHPELVLILAGDHIYKMNYAAMIDVHHSYGADVTVGCIPVPASQSRHFGVMTIDDAKRIVGFDEKPEVPETLPGDPSRCLASMGIYVFNARFLFEQLCQDATRGDSSHDFGRDLLPSFIETHNALAYFFRDENMDGGSYWRDVGTLDAYYEANFDLVQVEPHLNLYDRNWPIRTYQPQFPPPKFVFAAEGPGARRGQALDSLISSGCILSGGSVEGSILSANVRVNSYAEVSDSIVFEGVNIGRYAKIRRAIIDKDVQIPPETEIGYDLEQDAQRGFTVTEGGVVVIAKSEGIDRFLTPSDLENGTRRRNR